MIVIEMNQRFKQQDHINEALEICNSNFKTFLDFATFAQ